MVKNPGAGQKLAELVKHAMDDLEITTSEYREIMDLAASDHHVDAQERAILAQFHQMISDGTIRRIPG